MCIAFLSRFFCQPEIIEQIWLGVSEDGRLEVKEVYDFFFRTPRKMFDQTLDDVSFLALSPHDLRGGPDRPLSVAIERFPGQSGGTAQHDAVYGEDCNYRDKKFWIEIVAPAGRIESEFEKISGRVLESKPRLPEKLQNNGQIAEFMQRFGTLFELPLPTLEWDTSYVIRLVVDPVNLNPYRDPFVIRDEQGYETAQREYSLDVVSPTLLRDNFDTYLNEGRGDYPDGVPVIKEVLNAKDKAGRSWYTVPIRRHRLVLFYGPAQNIVQLSDQGSIWYDGPLQIEVAGGDASEVEKTNNPNRKQRKLIYRARRWVGGSEAVQMDDPFELACAVLRYMGPYGRDPKRKEDVTSALGGRHENVSCIVDALAEKGLLSALESGQYHTVVEKDFSTIDEETRASLQELVMSERVVAGFRAVGFRVMYVFEYQHESEAVLKKRKAECRRTQFAYWATWFSVFASLIALAFALWCVFAR